MPWAMVSMELGALKPSKVKRFTTSTKAKTFLLLKAMRFFVKLAATLQRLAFPYNPSDKKKGHLRYVEVTDIDSRKHRYFYVDPSVKYGDLIKPAMKIVVAQDLDSIYKTMKNHVHYEVKVNGEPVDPAEFL